MTKQAKRAMRSLGIIDDEQEHINQKAMNDYAKMFEQPLSVAHVQALAALFGWAPPDEPTTEEMV